jgi:hypothetical protein
MKVLLCFLMAFVMAALLSLMPQKRVIAKSCSAILTAILPVGFVAWMTPWFDFGLGRKKMDVSLTPGEVRDLQASQSLTEPRSLCDQQGVLLTVLLRRCRLCLVA